MARNLPVILSSVPTQKFSCQGCTRCCRDLVIHLSPNDVAAIDKNGWRDKLEVEPYVTLGRSTVLNKRSDGACVFLTDKGRCAIHEKSGLASKPLACRLFPFTFHVQDNRVHAGFRFDCPTVARSQGEGIASQRDSISRLAGALAPRLGSPADLQIQRGVKAQPSEIRCVIDSLATLVGTVSTLSGLEAAVREAAFVTEMLAQATLDKVRGQRFDELVNILVRGAADELAMIDAELASSRQRGLFRQLVYAHQASLPLEQMQGGFVARSWIKLRQLGDSRRFRRGRGVLPSQSSSACGVTFAQAEGVLPAEGDDAEPVCELLTRYIHTRLITHSFYGGAYYDWPVVDGLQALWLSVIAIGWVTRVEAAKLGRDRFGYDDVVSAIGMIDRAAGRLPALGSPVETMRMRYLTADHGVQRLLTTYPIVTAPESTD